MMAKANEKLGAARREMDAGFYGEVASRAYYAVFHAISAALFSRGITYSSHAQVVGEFNRNFVKTGEFSADTTRKLQRLFEDRQTADYDIVISFDEANARQALDRPQILRLAGQLIFRIAPTIMPGARMWMACSGASYVNRKTSRRNIGQ